MLKVFLVFFQTEIGTVQQASSVTRYIQEDVQSDILSERRFVNKGQEGHNREIVTEVNEENNDDKFSEIGSLKEADNIGFENS